MPHSGHVIVSVILEVMPVVLTDVVIGVLIISSRSGNGWCGIPVIGVRAGVHIVLGIEPGDCSNMSLWVAFKWTQAGPQSFWLNDVV